MLSPIIQSLTRARITVYHVAASLLALATMLSPSLGLSPSDDLGSINSRLIPMWGTPLGVVYRVLDLFNVPLDWIPEVVLYLVENPYRRAAIVGAACIISAALMFTRRQIALTPRHEHAPRTLRQQGCSTGIPPRWRRRQHHLLLHGNVDERIEQARRSNYRPSTGRGGEAGTRGEIGSDSGGSLQNVSRVGWSFSRGLRRAMVRPLQMGVSGHR
ncbi:hypothetical protein [Propioniciclava flava]